MAPGRDDDGGNDDDDDNDDNDDGDYNDDNEDDVVNLGKRSTILSLLCW